MIDGTDESKYQESIECLKNTLSHVDLKDIPLLILINKSVKG